MCCSLRKDVGREVYFFELSSLRTIAERAGRGYTDDGIYQRPALSAKCRNDSEVSCGSLTSGLLDLPNDHFPYQYSDGLRENAEHLTTNYTTLQSLLRTSGATDSDEDAQTRKRYVEENFETVLDKAIAKHTEDDKKRELGSKILVRPQERGHGPLHNHALKVAPFRLEERLG